MKKGLLVFVLLMVCTPFVWAQEMEQMERGQSGQAGGMMSKGKMAGMMQNDSLVATSDGGVVLRQGPRLIKYDASMNLIKEVEIPRGKKPSSTETSAPEVPAV